MIEIAPIDRELRLSYEEAIMYCFLLNIDGKTGWRLPTKDEWYGNDQLMGCWYIGRPRPSKGNWLLAPVRDLKDD
jgi:hypothetical protein